MTELLTTDTTHAVPLIALSETEFASWQSQQSEALINWLNTCNFSAKPRQVCLVADAQGGLESVIVGVKHFQDPFALASLNLPAGDYLLQSQTPLSHEQINHLCLGWALGGYRYRRYRQDEATPVARLVTPDNTDHAWVDDVYTAICLTRDLINTPANDLMPAELAKQFARLAETHQAQFQQWVGDELLENNFPMIHAVGRASSQAPRLLELRWGRAEAPKLALIGKGVCFDSGGLDMKSATGMRYMKKDMGGAAHAIALAELIMRRNLDVNLHLLVPAVENAVSGNSYRPGDIVNTRQGLRVEIDNTDAEGRLVLCDAITAACEHEPELLIDFATLTGAARVAVGTEIAALFCNDQPLASQLLEMSQQTTDPIWQLPLHADYRDMLDSKIADLANCSASGYAGAITAALFLETFIKPSVSWAHFDVMAWNQRPRPGRPEGGEAMGLRAVYHYLEKRYGTNA